MTFVSRAAAVAVTVVLLGLTPPGDFTLEKIATVPEARELAVAPNGDLFVGTESNAVDIVPNAEGDPAPARVFVRLDDRPVAGIAIDGDRLYLGAQSGVYVVPYHPGERSASAAPHKIASVRTGGGGGHVTTTVAVAGGHVFASVGSSCNACDEDDPTRATVQQMNPDGSEMTARAIHIRNAIALAVNPATGAVWAGAAGQDELPHGHPYEIFDSVTLHAGVADYGWPDCYENHRSVNGGDCSAQVVARVVFPAYDTPIGAVFYPEHPTGPHAFPQAYRGGAFLTMHGSWHQPPVPPRVVFVPMHGDTPETPVNWNDPSAQWREFVGGFQQPGGARIDRPTGIAVAPDGSLFFSNDQTGTIYRIRPR